MYCQECGSKLPKNAKFCSSCGTEVNLPVKKLKKENKKSKKKLLGIIAGVFVMLAVVVGGFFVYLENRTLFYLINPEMFFAAPSTPPCRRWRVSPPIRWAPNPTARSSWLPKEWLLPVQASPPVRRSPAVPAIAAAAAESLPPRRNKHREKAPERVLFCC